MATDTATRPEAPSRASTNGDRNLQQRILAVTEAVQVRITGKTAQNAPAMSISDVERALGDLLTEHGIVAGDYSFNDEPKVVHQQGNMATWQSDINHRMWSADDPSDFREVRLIDVGTSPSAAVSFALKRYYRAVFHLADDQDEQRAVAGTDRSRARASNGAPASASMPGSAPAPEQASGEATIRRLNEELPEGQRWSPAVLKAQLGRGADKALEEMVRRHQTFCGLACPHLGAEAPAGPGPEAADQPAPVEEEIPF